MDAYKHASHAQSGVSLVEVLVAMVILLVGLLGLAGTMMQGQRSEMESYQRVQALALLQDMVGRMNANRMAAHCYAFTKNFNAGTPVLGTTGTGHVTPMPSCTATDIINYYNSSQNTPYAPVSAPLATAAAGPAQQAVLDLARWDTELQGAAEKDAKNNQIGAVINARGCITYDDTQELPELDPQSGTKTGYKLLGTGIYTISIAWQGMGDSAAPGQPCATGLYMNAQGVVDDGQRRVVSLNVRMASLTK